MKLSIQEKKVLYAFACPNHHNTVTRLKWLTALTVDSKAKRWMLAVSYTHLTLPTILLV